MNPRKRAARSSSQGQRGNWKPKGAFNIQELPQALVIDILSRLSIKALYSCRCVCKDWLHIIHDPQFARLHLLRSPISILIKTSSRARDQGKFDSIHIAGSPMRVERMRFAPNNVLPVRPVSVVKLMNSCNGLLCVCEWMRYDWVYVCNPILGEYISIPFPDRNRHYSIDFVALGFNTRTTEYKIVQTNYYSNYAHEPEAMIYTIGTGVWRSIGKPPSGCRGGPIPFNSFLHGALHWIPVYYCPSPSIQSFDFEREEFRPLLLPPQVNKYIDLRLGVLKGCLFLCVFGGDGRKSDMWLMKNYGVQESWTKVFVIEHLYPRIYSSLSNVYEPILFLSDVEILMAYDRFMVHYNLETKCLEKTRIVQTRSQFQAFGYYPSFVSLHDVANGEEVKRIRDSNKFESLLSEA